MKFSDRIKQALNNVLVESATQSEDKRAQNNMTKAILEADKQRRRKRSRGSFLGW